jgi:DNA replicative helicase MCM subunit Mcm2 (Cdc46/Mcm family)
MEVKKIDLNQITVEDVELAIKILEAYLKNVQRVISLLSRVYAYTGRTGIDLSNPQRLVEKLMAQTLAQSLSQVNVPMPTTVNETEEIIISEEELEKFRAVAKKLKG